MNNYIATMSNNNSNNLLYFNVNDSVEDRSINFDSMQTINLRGEGSGLNIASQGSIRYANGKIYAVNSGSNSLSILQITENGPEHIQGSPFNTSIWPTSVAVFNNLVCVFCRGASMDETPGFKAIVMELNMFSLEEDNLKLLDTHPVRLAWPLAYPSDINFTPDGKKLIASWRNFENPESKSNLLGLLTGPLSLRIGSIAKWTVTAGGKLSHYRHRSLGISSPIGFSISPDSSTMFVAESRSSAIICVDLTTDTPNVLNKLKIGGKNCCWSKLSEDNNYLITTNSAGNRNVSCASLSREKSNIDLQLIDEITTSGQDPVTTDLIIGDHEVAYIKTRVGHNNTTEGYEHTIKTIKFSNGSLQEIKSSPNLPLMFSSGIVYI